MRKETEIERNILSRSNKSSTTSSTKKRSMDDAEYPVGRIFTKEELSAYDGSDSSKPIYLSVLGKVYDVSSGDYYTKQGSYNCFAGRDASRSFVTGSNLTRFSEVAKRLTKISVQANSRVKVFEKTSMT